MNQLSARHMVRVAIFMALPMAAIAQTPQPAGTLIIAGQQDQAPIVKINGKSYVDIESLARITHGSVRFQGSQTILTLPVSGSTAAATAQPARTPQLSEGYLSAEIEALNQIREWRASLAGAVQNNYPVTENWIGGLRRTADAKLQLAIAAATTDPDQKAVELLRNDFAAMLEISDQFLAMHTKANYTPPDSFDNNALDQKILSCQKALLSMAATKQFQDDPSCH
jgi:hypothetical protein